jgi:Leucine-rich repeat (LRR) protein
MASRLTVVLLLLLLASPALMFWFWLVFQQTRAVTQCPEECRFSEEGRNVDCSVLSLENIPSYLPTHVQVLVIDGNNITYFENNSFVSTGVIGMRILWAENCNIRKIELGAFNGITTLLYLSMLGNEISEIIPDTFEKMNSLEVLDLARNTIDHLESAVFFGLGNLKYINLQFNHLQYIHPDTFLGLAKLQGLDLS